MAKVARI